LENLEPVSNLDTETIEPTEVENQVVEEVEETKESASEEVIEEESAINVEPEDKEARKQRKLDQRFAELTRDKYELKRQLDELKAKQDKKPEFTEEDFGEDKKAWQNHQIETKIQEGLDKARQEDLQQSQKAEAQQQAMKQWQSKIDSFAEELPDYAGVLKDNPLTFLGESDVEVILESPVGPKIAYVLAKNPNLAEQYSSYNSQRSRDIFLTKLEMKIEAMPKKSQEKAVSKAPKPVPKMNSGKSGNVDPSTMSMAEYIKYRNGE
jgi:hypothetical protein